MRMFNRVALIPVICLVAVLAGGGMASFFDPHLPSADEWPTEPSSPSPIRVASRNTAMPPTLVPSTPTPSASATPTSAPTATSSPTVGPALFADPTPTAAQEVTEPTAAASATTAILLQQVDEATATLRTGEIDAELVYMDGSHSSAAVRFDLGDDQRAPRFQITTTYGRVGAVKTVERITIGDRAWQRESGGPWIEMAALEHPFKQLLSFLPRLDPAIGASAEEGPQIQVLRWYDANRGTDATLFFDRATGTLRALQQTARTSGAVLTITYTGWNTPVEILPPEAAR